MTRATTRTRLEQALARLLAGQPIASDGELTISGLCQEADVGRDSYYRSSQELKDTIAAAFASDDARQTELVGLRGEVRILKRERKHNARSHAAAVRELEGTIRAYANRIQVLAVRNAELEEHNCQLRNQLAGPDAELIALSTRS